MALPVSLPRGLQQAWKHAILAQPAAGARISLTFRSLRANRQEDLLQAKQR